MGTSGRSQSPMDRASIPISYPIEIDDFDSYAWTLLEDHPIRWYPTQSYIPWQIRWYSWILSVTGVILLLL